MSSFILFALATSIVLTLAYDTGGRIFFFSTSITKFSGCPPNYVLYTATKGAIEQMVRILSKDLGARGITVNAIAPGPIETELFMKGKSEQLVQFFANLHPQKRIGQPDEVSGIVAFLSRDEASWVNGQTHFVNGVSTAIIFCVQTNSSWCVTGICCIGR